MFKNILLKMRINQALINLFSKNKSKRISAGNFLVDVMRDPKVHYRIIENTFIRMIEHLKKGNVVGETEDILSITLAVATHHGATNLNSDWPFLVKELQSLLVPLKKISEDNLNKPEITTLANKLLSELQGGNDFDKNKL